MKHVSSRTGFLFVSFLYPENRGKIFLRNLMTLNLSHGVISNKTELFITTAVKALHPIVLTLVWFWFRFQFVVLIIPNETALLIFSTPSLPQKITICCLRPETQNIKAVIHHAFVRKYVQSFCIDF
jgi:hypothetical protein